MDPRFLAGCFRRFTTNVSRWKSIDVVADIITQLTEELSLIKLHLFLTKLTVRLIYGSG